MMAGAQDRATRASQTGNNTEVEVGAHVDPLLRQKISMRAGIYTVSIELEAGGTAVPANVSGKAFLVEV